MARAVEFMFSAVQQVYQLKHFDFDFDFNFNFNFIPPKLLLSHGFNDPEIDVDAPSATDAGQMTPRGKHSMTRYQATSFAQPPLLQYATMNATMQGYAIPPKENGGTVFGERIRQEPILLSLPHYSVAVQGVEDVQKAVNFAHDRDLYLVVKNTGHSHLGRSSGRGSFSIWTHNLKGKEWHESFVPEGAPGGTPGVHAVTLQAGEQWLDVYRAAAERNVIVVGGHARTVGSAGGYLTGGGHSPFAHFYGLAVDNLLEVDLVTADGSYQTINAYTDPDYFYALRGGGGSAWGVITSVTYKTHPNPAHIQVGLMQFNTTDESTLRTVFHQALQALPAVTDAGFTGYGIMGNGSFAALFLQPNATEEIFNTTFAPFYELTSHANVSAQVVSIPFPTWIDYCNAFLMDLNIATNVIDISRLLTSDDLLERTNKLVDVIFEFDEFSAGFNFIGKVNSAERDNTAVHPTWKDSRALFSLGTDWADDASAEEKLRKKLQAVEISKRLGDIVGPDGGTYVNEANPYEPDWQNVFWGPKYDRLLSIKKRIDPTNLFVCNRCVGTDVLFKP
ncbi:hypothetical protein EPUS_03096 [Endocarpon pusillum Z07020]|uniref:FAD-binding PCMH-type domain-containing protein n=1 Tax=Endocarpon pusillum (strain Z07020 / HMAS-L-300199) TaxID=1263415 RepID=U1HV93_ENDPU|nr:uncharacterized protein EPUS_03096 [Endocarpon pusillum Z07020]ERF73264.1 hypothetical protein EPUS_03096 [Endocarpon pusillum Z07020]